MLTRDDVLMGRDAEFPLTEELEANLSTLLDRLKLLGDAYYADTRNLLPEVSSGYRPGYYNEPPHARGAPNSPHKTCEAIDFKDPYGVLRRWCADNTNFLATYRLRLEHPGYTPGWCHLDTRYVDHVIFIP